jgi:hypothetical protein
MRVNRFGGFRSGAAAAIAIVVACSARPLADKPSCKGGGSCPPGWGCGADNECVFVGSGGVSGFGGGFGGTSAFGGIGGVGGVGGVSGSGGFQNVTLGGPCQFDWECSESGLGCMRADSGLLDAASPAKGLCTVSCAADESVCAAIEPGAQCLKLPSGAAYCVEGCTFGPIGAGFSSDKCHGRTEMACSPIAAGGGLGACVPRCNSDADCETGWNCHPRDGFCWQDPPQGSPLGSACTPAGDGGVDPCEGVCDEALCGQGCTWGVTLACGFSDLTQPAPGYCLLGDDGIQLGFGPGAGDLGQCVALCDCDDQCSPPQLCLPLGDGDLVQTTQRQGFCGSGAGSLGPCN